VKLLPRGMRVLIPRPRGSDHGWKPSGRVQRIVALTVQAWVPATAYGNSEPSHQ
jgi:hypothetical protein